MALLFLDSFDHYATADATEKWTTVLTSGTGAFAISAGNGRRSSSSVRFSRGSTTSFNFTAALQKVLAPADATMTLGVAIKVPSGQVGTAGMSLACVRDGTTAQVTLRVNSNLTLTVLRGPANGTVLGTTTATLVAGVAAFVEWKVVVHPSAGTVDLQINGTSVLSLTGQNTRNTAVTQWTSVLLGVPDSIANTVASDNNTNCDFDDFYVLDGSGPAPWNTFLGDVRVDARYPSGAGASSGWTPSAAPNWSCVDDPAPDDDTTYVSSLTAATDTYALQDAAVAGAAIYGVQLLWNIKKMDAGACVVAPVVRQGTTNLVGTAQNPGTTYGYQSQVYQTNPHTAAAWTESEFNADEFGLARI